MERRRFVAAIAGLPLIGRLVPPEKKPPTPTFEWSMSSVTQELVLAGTGADGHGPYFIHRPVEVFKAVVHSATKDQAFKVAMDCYGQAPDSVTIQEFGESAWTVTAAATVDLETGS